MFEKTSLYPISFSDIKGEKNDKEGERGKGEGQLGRGKGEGKKEDNRPGVQMQMPTYFLIFLLIGRGLGGHGVGIVPKICSIHPKKNQRRRQERR